MKKFLSINFGLSTIFPFLIILIFNQKLEPFSKIGLLYLGLILGICFFNLVGKNKGHLYDFSKLWGIFGVCLFLSLIIGATISLSEKIDFTKSFFIASIIIYSIYWTILFLNLKK